MKTLFSILIFMHFFEISIAQKSPSTPPPPPPPPPKKWVSPYDYQGKNSLIHPSKIPKDSIISFSNFRKEGFRFPGCEDIRNGLDKYLCAKEKMETFIDANMNYPIEAWENNIEGIAIAKFLVYKDGSIRDIELAHDIGYGCGKELIRIIKRMPNFQPTRSRGRPLRETIYISIEFSKIDYFIKKAQ